MEAKLQSLVLELLRARPGLVHSAHDVSDGGLAIAIGECCAATDDARRVVGVEITLPPRVERRVAGGRPCSERPEPGGDHGGSPGDVAEIERRAGEKGVPVNTLGRRAAGGW